MSQNPENNTSDILVNSITELLVGNSPAERAQAARNLGRTRNKIATTYLIQGLSDRAPEVRLAAVQVLSDLGDPAAIEPLSKLLDSERPLVDRSAIVGALDALRGTNSLDDQPAEVKSLTPVSSSPIEIHTSDHVQADDFQAHNVLDLTEVWPAGLKMSEVPQAISISPVVGDDDGELLAQSSRRAAAERKQLEEARRRSNEEASRRAAEEMLRLETEAEVVTRLQENIARRRSELEVAGRVAKEEQARLGEIEAQAEAEEAIREKAQADLAQLEAEARGQTANAKARIAELHRRITEQQHRSFESELSLERLIRLGEEAAKQHQAEEERLRAEQTALEHASNGLSLIRADVQAAREEAEKEALRLKEARDLLLIEQQAYQLAEELAAHTDTIAWETVCDASLAIRRGRRTYIGQ